MKETKVYVDELPKDCFKCLFMTDNQEGYDGCFCKILDERAETKSRLKGCPLIDIKTHDRELVEKVLEKTKTFVRENTYICGGDATREDIITSSSYNQALRDFLDFMETLQKEMRSDKRM